jgi:hypothetical protein
MRSVKTVATNHNFGPPAGRESEIGDLPCQWAREEPYGEVIWSVWVPSDDERKAIADGWNVRLGVGWIGAFPPVSVGITHLTESAE